MHDVGKKIHQPVRINYPIVAVVHQGEVDPSRVTKAAGLPSPHSVWGFTDLGTRQNEHNALLHDVSRYAAVLMVQDTLFEPQVTETVKSAIASALFSSYVQTEYCSFTLGSNGVVCTPFEVQEFLEVAQ